MVPQVEPWAACPLKQEIRAGIWESYLKNLTGGAALRSYLTLYSPSLMDVKYFAERGLIIFDREVYKGVVGVTFSALGYPEAVRRGEGRLELLLIGDIRQLLTQTKSRKHKQLYGKFPFDAVNFDYTDSLFRANITGPISPHFEALEELFEMQARSGCEKFCLFLTTRAEQQQFAHRFILELERRVDDNIMNNPIFGQAFYGAYSVNTAGNLLISDYDKFVELGIIKLVASMLSDCGFEVIDCNNQWLIRDVSGGGERLLHLTFLIEKKVRGSHERATSMGQYGRRGLQHRVRQVIGYMNNRVTNELVALRESVHGEEMKARQGEDIDRLLSKTYELKVPEHEAD